MNRVFKTVFLAFVIIGLAQSAFAAISTELSDQGSGVKTKSTGLVLSKGNLTVLIYTSSADGTEVYNETFTDTIINGSWNVMLGENTPLYLQFNRKYYKDYLINGEDANFTNSSGGVTDRQGFYSPLGELGEGTNADGQNSIASGYNSNASDASSIAMGDQAKAISSQTIAIGQSATAEESWATAIGYGTLAHGFSSTALGDRATAMGLDSFAAGRSVLAYGQYSTALGRLTNATGIYSTAMGSNATASGTNSFAWGGASCTSSTCNNAQTSVFAVFGGACIANATTACPALGDGAIYINDFMKLRPSSTPPSPTEGMVYFNATLHKPCYYNGNNWKLFNESLCG